MFDIGFLEIFVVLVVGLLVIGPEHLPATIKTTAIWISRVKRSLTEARAEFEQQIGMDDIRREIHNEEIMKSLKALASVKETAQKEIAQTKEQLNAIARGDLAAGQSANEQTHSPSGDTATEGEAPHHEAVTSDDLDPADSPQTLPGRKAVKSGPESGPSGEEHAS